MKNHYEVDNLGVAHILVKRNNGDIYTVLIDAEDIDRIERDGCGNIMVAPNYGIPYARIRVPGRHNSQQLHRYLLGAMDEPPCRQVDHINHDTLDCRKENLELVSARENSRRRRGWRKSKTGVRNVYEDTRAGGYYVRLTRYGFTDLAEAKRVADATHQAMHAPTLAATRQ